MADSRNRSKVDMGYLLEKQNELGKGCGTVGGRERRGGGTRQRERWREERGRRRWPVGSSRLIWRIVVVDDGVDDEQWIRL